MTGVQTCALPIFRLLHDLFHPRDPTTHEPQESAFAIEYIESLSQRADIFTKAFRDAPKWKVALNAILIGKVPRNSRDMPTGVVVPTTTVSMPAGRGDATAGILELPSEHKDVLINMLEDAVRRYIVKGTNQRINLQPNAPRDKHGKHITPIPSDVIQWDTPDGQEIYHLCKLLNPDFDWEFVTINKFDDASQCEHHKDTGNKGVSRLILFGPFVGGALVLDDGRELKEKRVWHEYDGVNIWASSCTLSR